MNDVTATWGMSELPADVGVLRILSGPASGQEFAFLGEGTVAGSAEHAKIRIPDRTVSRLHCEFVAVGNRVRVRDLGSKNGVWLGACRIGEIEVAPGTHLKLATTAVEITMRQAKRMMPIWRGGHRLDALVGRSEVMHRLFAATSKVAGQTEPVLITGESGTGKELVARAVHNLSLRSGGPFVVVDGPTLSSELASNELFGHVRGAFTGADQDRPGAFERASGGTLLLDEIADVPPEVQPKLLRVLDEGSVQRVGDNERRNVDVRVLAATSRPLAQLVNEKMFREDLWFRLSVFELRVPALRERGRDLGLLARHLARQHGTLSSDAIDDVERLVAARASYHWPGNVRELRNAVRRTLALGFADAIDGHGVVPADVGVCTNLTFAESKRRWVEAFERRYLLRLLDEHQGNVTAAAAAARMHRTHLSQLITAHGLRRQ
ncbi:MAG: sigma 54-interacting transcriptional regulator [Myxococcota bacterium]